MFIVLLNQPVPDSLNSLGGVNREIQVRVQGELKLLRLPGGSFGIVNLKVGKKGAVKEFISEEGSRQILTLLSPFLGLLLYTQEGQERKRVGVKW